MVETSCIYTLVLSLWCCALGVCMANATPKDGEAADGLTMTLLHTNDVHARFEQTNKYGGICRDTVCFGGVSRRYTEVTRIRKSHRNVLLLDAGDQYQGTLWFVHYGGQAAAHFMDVLNYTVMTLGNHEFDRGVTGLVPFLQNVSFPVVSSNIDTSADDRIKSLLKPSVVLEVEGYKVGVIGVTTSQTPELVKPDDINKLIFKNEVESVRAEVAKLKDDGVNIIIALSHCGFTLEKIIAAEVDGLDLIIGGHTNTFLYSGSAPSNEEPVGPYPTWVTSGSGRKVAVLQAFTFGKYLGYLNVTFSKEGELLTATGNPILLNNNVPQDAEVEAQVEEWAAPLKNISTTKIGRSLVYLEGSRQVCRLSECNMGNVMTDAMLLSLMTRTINQEVDSKIVSIAFWNSGGIRGSIEKGEITLGDVLTVVPFQNLISVVRLYGKHLLEVFEHSVAKYNTIDPPGAFLQVSGVQVVYSLNRTTGSRVVRIDVRCSNCTIPSYSPLDMDKVYTVATSDFLFSGGDGYKTLVNNVIDIKRFDILDSIAFREYCEMRDPVVQGTEGRIRFVDEPVEPDEPDTNTASRMASESIKNGIMCASLTTFLLWHVFLAR